MSVRKVLVTGATGLVGGHVLSRLAVQGGLEPIAAVRSPQQWNGGLEARAFVLAEAEHLPRMDDIDTVVHCAARVHVMRQHEGDQAEFSRLNVDGTLLLARAAAASGVRQFIYLSSVKVHGESTPLGKPFDAQAPYAPKDAYAQSKVDAEVQLKELSRTTDMVITIIRPPLVYGAGVRANFQRMMHAVSLRVPMPVAAIKNKRSLVFVENLADLVVTCLGNPNAENEAFLVSDGEDLSTVELLSALAKAFNVRLFAFPVPSFVLNVMAGRFSSLARLTGSLQVDVQKNAERLGWAPPYRYEFGLYTTVQAFKEQAK
ncbi:NAD-dependent epimerase/dehydratase family protein [Pseudomonas silvicola]|nr:NAD-dependent epimerase/dehydratase family protein [Pseudomonas silvicola]